MKYRLNLVLIQCNVLLINLALIYLSYWEKLPVYEYMLILLTCLSTVLGRWFWSVLQEMSVAQQKQVLLFTTGSDRIPVGGMGEMTFKISCWKGYTHMLPQAHTCFNQLVLPPYGSRHTLQKKLLIAISNSEGFGLE